MQLLQKLLLKVNGLRFGQEYLCLDREQFGPALRLYLVHNDRVAEDITGTHVFAGYSPLIFALFNQKETSSPAGVEICFTHNALQLNDPLPPKAAIARLKMDLFRNETIEGTQIGWYLGKTGIHRMIPAGRQRVIGLYNSLYNQKAGNVFLKDNLLKQVQIAYSLPRAISLVTVADGGFYNLFPTDLHGPVKDPLYISSLRHGGKACSQVIKAGRLVISDVTARSYEMVYSLGKNHMRESAGLESFPFSKARSKTWQLPLPSNAVRYRELELIREFDQGIHKLLLYRVVSLEELSPGAGSLAHIHNVYGTWRYNNGLSGNYLLR